METWLSHPTEDALEAYALNRLGEAEAAPLEEHLLLCEPCQTKLQLVDEFVLAFRESGEAAVVPKPSRVRFFNLDFLLGLSPQRAILIGAFTVFLIVLAIEQPSGRTGSPVQVELTAFRGSDSGLAATAPARLPLSLTSQVPDLPSCGQCSIEIVDKAGVTKWSASGSIAEGRLNVTANVTLPSGMYWVRLHTGDGALAREFALRLQ